MENREEVHQQGLTRQLGRGKTSGELFIGIVRLSQCDIPFGCQWLTVIIDFRVQVILYQHLLLPRLKYTVWKYWACPTIIHLLPSHVPLYKLTS